MDVPMFIFMPNRVNTPRQKKFIKDTKADISATISFLYSRGMWSKYHYNKWMAELKACDNEEVLHLWWDSIVSGAMAETESPIEEAIEDMSEKMSTKMFEAKKKNSKKSK